MKLLEVKDLKTSFFLEAGEVKAVNGLSFTLDKGKVLGIVGESGSGKSVSAYSIMQILSHPGKIVSGSIKYNGHELIGESEDYMRQIRGNKISIIFQDPMTSLTPTFTVGNQLVEAITIHSNISKDEAKKKALEMLTLVGINEPERRFKQYPFELSGGMRQRVMIAMALVCEPDILIADEPTTALDVTIQAQILDLMKELQKKFGMAIIMITHDMGVIAEICDEVIVMYGGKACERGTTESIFHNPKHEYTKGLMRSIPNFEDDESKKLIPIGGTPIDLLNMPSGCAFGPRCDKCMKICLKEMPKEYWIGKDHLSSCWMNLVEGNEKGTIKYDDDGNITYIDLD